MNKKILLIVGIILTIIVAILGSLMIGNAENPPKILFLNQTQKDILIEQDLPLNWNHLSSTQKEMLLNSEDMMKYLENKYDEKFVFNSYSVNEKGLTMTVRSPKYNNINDFISVKKIDDEYIDTYMNVFGVQEFGNKFVEKLQKNFPNEQLLFISKDLNISVDKPQKTLENYYSNVTGKAILFVSNVSEENFENIVKEVENICLQNKFNIEITINMVDYNTNLGIYDNYSYTYLYSGYSILKTETVDISLEKQNLNILPESTMTPLVQQNSDVISETPMSRLVQQNSDIVSEPQMSRLVVPIN